MAGDLSVGNNNGTVNRVASFALTGGGTELIVSNKIEVGRNAASGQLKVNAFAKASGVSAVVGVNRGARGDVWVDGPGAHWTTAQNVTVGAFGVGVVRTANVGLIAVGAFVLCLLAAIVPAVLAARLDAIDLLRYE